MPKVRFNEEVKTALFNVLADTAAHMDDYAVAIVITGKGVTNKDKEVELVCDSYVFRGPGVGLVDVMSLTDHFAEQYVNQRVANGEPMPEE